MLKTSLKTACAKNPKIYILHFSIVSKIIPNISHIKGEVLSTKILILLSKICFHYNSFLELKKKSQILHYKTVFMFTVNFRKVSGNVTSEFCLLIETTSVTLCEHYTAPLLAAQKVGHLSHIKGRFYCK